MQIDQRLLLLVETFEPVLVLEAWVHCFGLQIFPLDALDSCHIRNVVLGDGWGETQRFETQVKVVRH